MLNNISKIKGYTVYRKGNSIDVDCGLGSDVRPGLLCLDTMKEIYF